MFFLANAHNFPNLRLLAEDVRVTYKHEAQLSSKHTAPRGFLSTNGAPQISAVPTAGLLAAALTPLILARTLTLVIVLRAHRHPGWTGRRHGSTYRRQCRGRCCFQCSGEHCTWRASSSTRARTYAERGSWWR